MEDIDKQTVLVLNKNWQAIGVKSIRDAFTDMSTDNAVGLDISPDSMVPVKWEEWIKLPIREHDGWINTSRLQIRKPTVIVSSNYASVPMKRPRLTKSAIYERDGGICIFSGKKLSRKEATVEHLLPRSRGGKNSWQNCAVADRKINHAKADKTVEEAGLKTLYVPKEPVPKPISSLIRNVHNIPDWNIFLKH